MIALPGWCLFVWDNGGLDGQLDRTLDTFPLFAVVVCLVFELKLETLAKKTNSENPWTFGPLGRVHNKLTVRVLYSLL